MAQSGQLISQIRQRLHFSGITLGAGLRVTPLSLLKIRALLGHFSKQMPQPLHNPKKTVQEPFLILVVLGSKFFIHENPQAHKPLRLIYT